MTLSSLAGLPAPRETLIGPAQVEREYYARRPDPADRAQQVSFGTSGHRGSPLTGPFNEAHILAISQANCEYRSGHDIIGPLYMGRDTHAVSAPAQRTALEALAANGVDSVIQRDDGVTSTPVSSWTILTHNQGRTAPERTGRRSAGNGGGERTRVLVETHHASHILASQAGSPRKHRTGVVTPLVIS